jgi:hypothetical protein
MTWYVALDSDKNILPLLMKEKDEIVIPFKDVNSTFSFDQHTWEITERFPVCTDGTVTWDTKVSHRLVGLEPMSCLPDIYRTIQKRSWYKGKTILIDDQKYVLKIEKRNDYTGAYFSALDEEGNYHEIRFDDYKMYLGQKDGRWVEKELEFFVG